MVVSILTKCILSCQPPVLYLRYNLVNMLIKMMNGINNSKFFVNFAA